MSTKAKKTNKDKITTTPVSGVQRQPVVVKRQNRFEQYIDRANDVVATAKSITDLILALRNERRGVRDVLQSEIAKM